MQDTVSLCIPVCDLFFYPTSVQHHFGLKGGVSPEASLLLPPLPFQATILRNDLTLPLSRTSYIGALLNIMEKRRISTQACLSQRNET